MILKYAFLAFSVIAAPPPGRVLDTKPISSSSEPAVFSALFGNATHSTTNTTSQVPSLSQSPTPSSSKFDPGVIASSAPKNVSVPASDTSAPKAKAPPKSASGPITAYPKKGKSTFTPTVNPYALPTVAASPDVPQNNTQSGGQVPKCKTVVGDAQWPSFEVWRAALPNVKPVALIGRDAHPNFFLAAKNLEDVQTAVKFSAEHNVRLSVISSGQDYLGR